MKDETKQQPEKTAQIELEGCIAYPTGAGCPLEWCRKARGDWCKDKNGHVCKNKKI